MCCGIGLFIVPIGRNANCLVVCNCKKSFSEAWTPCEPSMTPTKIPNEFFVMVKHH
jgi:hypothetical protein